MLFWVAMALIAGGSIAITFIVAAREYEAPELQRRPSVAIQASEVLGERRHRRSEGLAGLRSRIDPGPRPLHHRPERCGHPRPASVRRARRIAGVLQPRRLGQSRRGRPGSRDRRRAARQSPPQPARAADRRRRRHGVHRAVGAAASQHLRRIESAGNIADHSCIALVVSALTSWWLAQHLSAPIRRIQAGARALASENLDVRVSAGAERRPRGPQGRARGSGAGFRRHGGSAACQSQRDHAAVARHLSRIAVAARANARRLGAGAPNARRHRRASWIAWSARSSASTR